MPHAWVPLGGLVGQRCPHQQLEVKSMDQSALSGLALHPVLMCPVWQVLGCWEVAEEHGALAAHQTPRQAGVVGQFWPVGFGQSARVSKCMAQGVDRQTRESVGGVKRKKGPVAHG